MRGKGSTTIMDKEAKRRRRERILIFFTLLLLCVITYVEILFLNVGLEGPLFNSIFFFALINLNSILLLLLIFLVVRNLVKLLLERKRKTPGAKLKTKLVAGFVGLSLMPTLLLFIISLQFISTSVEQWFNLNVEKSLQDSLELGKIYYQNVISDLEEKGQKIKNYIQREDLWNPAQSPKLEAYLKDKGKEWNLALAGLYGMENQNPVLFCTEELKPHLPLSDFEETLKKAMGGDQTLTQYQSVPLGDAVFTFLPLRFFLAGSPQKRVLVMGAFIPLPVMERINGISKGYEEYEQIRMLQNPIKLTHYITLSIITLLIIFFATWFGFYLAKGITVPIQKLVEGTHSIASGNYDVHVDAEARDEIGTLVESFNRMALDLNHGKTELDKTNRELLSRTHEVEQRKTYMEVVLDNIATGVISVDADGRISTINRSAENILSVRSADLLNRHYKELLRPPYDFIVSEFIDELNLTKSGSVGKTIKLPLGSETRTLMVKLNLLQDENDRYMGMVVVLEDLSHIEKAQRMSAWREVARRIAHEVKNPLTPIQLSTQRLQKRYRSAIAEDVKVFDECTGTIITQVEELKKLVNEFSNFARMPSAEPSPNDLNQIIEETLALYEQAHREITFRFLKHNQPPVFNLDREQIKRVLINLMDNALDAMYPQKGEVEISLDYDSILNIARIEVADNGEGISPEDKLQLFEPYFSTKKSGTGLGLAIVSTIVSDHYGYIRVHDNKPQGTRFVIELPVRI